MAILILLAIWLLALIFITNKFRREENYKQQRLFSVILIVWAVLGIVYYDVLMITTGGFTSTAVWQNYIPVVGFSICAGIGTYFLLMTFTKLRQKIEEADNKQKKGSKKSGKKK
ncbi:MAG: hypothetical protein IIX62_01370 [Peptococcaceae bacterium]|nr:hypothetical protein [Peptococcaceae bacterium]